MLNKADWELVNQAIQNCLTIGPLANWHYEESIKNEYGENILITISKILEFVDLIIPNWEKENFQEFLERCRVQISRTYNNCLVQKSINILVNRIAYGCK